MRMFEMAAWMKTSYIIIHNKEGTVLLFSFRGFVFVFWPTAWLLWLYDFCTSFLASVAPWLSLFLVASVAFWLFILASLSFLCIWPQVSRGTGHNYESQLCWAELPRFLNEAKYSNIRGEQRFMYHRFSLSLRLGWHLVRAHLIFLY